MYVQRQVKRIEYLFIGHLNEVFKIINQNNLKLWEIKGKLRGQEIDNCFLWFNSCYYTHFLHFFAVISQLNKYCEIDLNCQRAVPFTVCLPNKLCACREGFLQENGTCFSSLGRIIF